VLAKRFMYVCAGLFLLALTYHLGARSAIAQPPTGFAIGGGGQGTSSLVAALVINGSLYTGNSTQSYGPFPLPKVGGTIVGVTAYREKTAMVIYEDGDWFNQGTAGGVPFWVYGGNLLGNPTAAVGSTWGKVKADYRK